MSAIQLATAYVSLVVSTKGIGTDVSKELNKVGPLAERAGQSAGSKMANAFKGSSKFDTSKSEADLKRLKDTAERASSGVKKAKQEEETAQRKAATAAQAYKEAVEKSGEGSARAMAASDRLVTAQQKSEAAAHKTAAAIDAETAALKDVDQAAGKAGDEVTTMGGKFKNALKSFGDKINPFSKFKKNAGDAGTESAKSFSSKAKSGLKGFAGSVGKLLGPLAAVAGVGALGAGLKGAIDDAGQLEQSVGAIESIFKDSAGQMKSWSDTAATSVGLTKNEYNELGTLMGAQLKNGGTAAAELAGKTNELITTGADLSSMFGGTTADAVAALSSALKGERDPIEKYGVSLKQTQIDAEAAALGFEKVGGSLSAEANQAATLSLIMKQTKDAHGNFAKESDTYAHKVQVMSARWADLKTGIGTKLLPVVMAIWDVFDTKVMPVLGKLGEKFAPLGEAIGQVAGSFTAMSGPGSKSAEVVEKVQGAFGKVGAVLRDVVGPIFGQIWGTIVNAVQTNGPAIQGIIGKVGDAFSGAGELMSALGDRISSIWKAISPTVLPIIRGFISGILGVFNGLFTTLGGIMDVFTSVFKGDWQGVKDGVVKIVDGLGKAVGSLFTFLKDSVVLIVGNLATGINNKMQEGRDWVIGKARELKDGTIGKFRELRDGAATAVGELYTRATGKVGEIKTKVLDTFSNMWTGVKDSFRTGVNTVGTIFDGLKAKAKAPIKFVINTVINDGLINGVNFLANKVGLGKPLSRVSLPAGFHTGGILAGKSSWRDGDDQIIRARKGEGIAVSEVMDDPYERERLLALNAAAVRGVPIKKFREQMDFAPGFATGGRVNPGGRGIGNTYPRHTGRDWPMPMGTPIRAAGDGVITRTAKLARSYGWHIRQRLDEGMGAVYAHLSNIGVKAGQRVSAGQQIGRSGNTGNSSGPHLHFGINESPSATVAFLRGASSSALGSPSEPINPLAKFGKKAMDLFNKAGQAVADFAGGPFKMFQNAIGGGLAKLKQLPGSGVFGDVIKKVPDLVIKGLKDFLADKVGIPHFANGGTSQGGIAVVGERGPELVHLPRNSYVQPNHQLGMGGNVTQYINVNIPPEALNDVETMISWLRTLGLRAHQMKGM